MNIWLPILVLWPLLSGVALLLLRCQCISDSLRERIAIIDAFAIFGITLILAITLNQSPENMGDATAVITPYIEFAPSGFRLLLPASLATNSNGWQMSLGLDGIGLTMVLLTTLVTCAVLVIANSTITKNRGDYAAWMLICVSGLLLVFTAMDLVLFYVGFELTLIPLFALVGAWGQQDAYTAAKRFVLYTLVGSIPMVLALLGISQLYATEGGWTIQIPELARRAAAVTATPELAASQAWIFGLLVLGLGIKMAILPLHTWLPTTYAASHPTTAAFLAAIVLKMGLFGFVRLALPMTPLACAEYGPSLLGWLGAVAIVYGALVALAQKDLRLLLAYSSLSHVGFITIGLFALNEEGIGGAVLQMFNHGITTAAMFLLAACVIARRGTARLDQGSRGLASVYPRLAFFMVFFVAAAAGMPGLNNFVGESLTLTAMLIRQPWVAALGILGIVLGAWYAFRLSQQLLFGKLEKTHTRDGIPTLNHDLTIPEKSVFALLAAVCLIIGVIPNNAMRVFKNDAAKLGQVCESAVQSQAALAKLESLESSRVAAYMYSPSTVQHTIAMIQNLNGGAVWRPPQNDASLPHMMHLNLAPTVPHSIAQAEGQGNRDRLRK